MANAKHVTVPFPYQYEPSTSGAHGNDGDGKGFEWMDSGFSYHNNCPTITHGNKDGWSTYGLYNNYGTSKRGSGWYAKDPWNNCVRVNWGDCGSKHTSIISIGGNQGLWLPVGGSYEHTGVGFKVWRHRNDSNKNNNNAEQHCIHLRRWGVEFIKRADNTTKFWSSPGIAYHGGFGSQGTTESSSSNIWEYLYYKMMFKDTGLGHDYVVKRLWFNLATKNGNYANNANTNFDIHFCRAYHDMHGSSNTGNRWIKPKWRSLSDRNKFCYKFS
jgi:hypothetical protein